MIRDPVCGGNKGIELSRGDYVWLISADDRLRCSDVLEKYVMLMEAHPEVGYVICPGFGLVDREETCLLEQRFIKDEDVTVGELIKEKIGLIGENIQIGRFARFEI